MAKRTQLYLEAALLLTMGLQVTVAESVVFNLETKIQEYAQRMAQQHNTKVLWWDTHGEKLFHPKERYSSIGFGLGGGLGRVMVAKQLGRYKLYIKTGPIQYGNVSSTGNRSTVIHTEWIEASTGRIKTTFKKSKEYTRRSSWSSQLTISSGFELSLTAGLPMGWGGTSKYHTGMNLTAGMAEDYIESETLSVQQQITTPPMTSAKIEWIVVDQVQEIPWTVEVTVQGWFAVCLDKKLNGKYVQFPLITALQDPLLKKVNDQTVRFTVKGVFTGVKTIGGKLKVTNYDPEAYSRIPLATALRDIPLR